MARVAEGRYARAGAGDRRGTTRVVRPWCQQQRDELGAARVPAARFPEAAARPSRLRSERAVGRPRRRRPHVRVGGGDADRRRSRRARDSAGVDIVATSLGGYYALRTASVHPDRVRHVRGARMDSRGAERSAAARDAADRRAIAGAPHDPCADERANGAVDARSDRAPSRARTGRFPQEGVDSVRRAAPPYEHDAKRHGHVPPIIHPIRGMNDSILLTQELLRHVARARVLPLGRR